MGIHRIYDVFNDVIWLTTFLCAIVNVRKMECLDKRESCSKIMEDYYKHLDEMRRRGTFCDAQLICRDDKRHSFPIHRAVLASCSPYFRALFTSGMTEAQNLHVEIPGIGSEAMNAIISYAYTRKFEISTDNVENLLSAADRFHVFGILKACGDFLYTQLSVENCIGIYKFANFHHCEQLSRKVWSYILVKFCEIAEESTEFLQLDISDLTTMLADDELNVRFEEDAFDAAVRWINFMPQTRKRYYCELLPNFRLGHINTDYFLEHVYTNPEIQHRRDCQSVMKEAWDTIQSIRSIGVVSSDARNPFLRPRVPHEVIFLVGGWARNGVTMSVETYDTRADKWYHAHPTLCAPRAYHGSVAMNNLIYVVGGYDGTRYHNSVLCFDPIKVAWREVAPMYAARCYVAVAELNGYVYACGGYDGRLRHNSVERYNPLTNQWSYVASMHRQRSDSGSAAVCGKCRELNRRNDNDNLLVQILYTNRYN